MQPAVEVVLAGDSSASLQHGQLLSSRLQSELFFQPESSPQRAESLSAVVRQLYTNLIVQILTATGTRQVFHLSIFSQ
ncbi:hypothetical protein ABN16_02725 [Levilactobacillus koreensis]|uniref:Uncharacterized protein n=1 Tax=Levilactobacillus koreensis TaxID=637971 RepID=A0AAC8UU95_9LACO|nr:hypothetical protein ABN16_02725 [Levilactobacillus koreensis]